jgi:hypothetical protein
MVLIYIPFMARDVEHFFMCFFGHKINILVEFLYSKEKLYSLFYYYRAKEKG